MKNNHMVPFMLYQQHSSKTRPACLWWRLVWHLVQLLSFSSWLLGYWPLLLCTVSFSFGPALIFSLCVRFYPIGKKTLRFYSELFQIIDIFYLPKISGQNANTKPQYKNAPHNPKTPSPQHKNEWHFDQIPLPNHLSHSQLQNAG